MKSSAKSLKYKIVTKRAVLESHIKLFSDKNLLAFDLDGTLTESKSNMDMQMAELLCKLLLVKKVAVIGGGAYDQFKNQFIKQLDYFIKKNPEFLRKHKTAKEKIYNNLYLFPTTGLTFYKYKKGKWTKVYELTLSKRSQNEIKHAFHTGFDILAYDLPTKIYGKMIENRKTQITFSALGQKAPLKAKETWHSKYDIRKKIIKVLHKIVPNYEIHIGGLTSIDVTRKDTDKGFAINQIKKYLKLDKSNIAFIGDAVFKGGNDYEALKAGVLTIKIDGPKDTKEIIKAITKGV